jgi:cysteinyl-tRNA synthetase
MARKEGRDARGAMLDWVEEIARFGRDRKAGFLVVGQNAMELAADERYLASVDAVAQEQDLRQLRVAQARGKVVLTVDYALEPRNVARVLAASRALGFVPFVSGRALDTYVPPQ